MQYADFAVWQREWLAGRALEGQLAYWREQLAGAPPLLELPTDRPRPRRAGRAAAQRQPFALLPAGVARLRALGRREGATLFMIAARRASRRCSARYTGQDDLVVGTADRQPRRAPSSRG